MAGGCSYGGWGSLLIAFYCYCIWPDTLKERFKKSCMSRMFQNVGFTLILLINQYPAINVHR